MSTISESHVPHVLAGIVIGKVFLDSRGGKLRRKLSYLGMNPKQNKNNLEKVIREVLKNNYTNTLYPHFGVAKFVELGIAT